MPDIVPSDKDEISVFTKITVLGTEIDVYGDIVKPIFKAADVATLLEYAPNSTAKVTDKVPESEKKCYLYRIGIGGHRRIVNFLTERGLYMACTAAHTPKGDKAREEAADIFIELRNKGMVVTEELLKDPMRLASYTVGLLQKTIAEKDRQLVFASLEIMKKSDDIIVQQNYIDKIEEKIDVLEPKAEYCDSVLQHGDKVIPWLISSEYAMSAGEFNKLLVHLGIQHKKGGVWYLYGKYAGQGYTCIDTVHKAHSPGYVEQMKWTQAGRLFLHAKLKEMIGFLPVSESGYNGGLLTFKDVMEFLLARNEATRAAATIEPPVAAPVEQLALFSA